MLSTTSCCNDHYNFYAFFLYVFLLFVCLLPKEDKLNLFIHSFTLIKELFLFFLTTSIALSEQQMLLRNIPMLRSSFSPPYAGLFSLSAQKIHRRLHTFCKKKIFRNRGEYMPEELCYLWLCSWTWPQKSWVSRAQAVTGGKWPATSQGEPQVPVSNEGIHTAMGSDTTVVYHVLVLPIACPSHIHFPAFTCSVSRCHHAAQSPLTQPKQPTAWHFL